MVNNKAILHPQEIETFYIIPTLRRYLALALKERGMKQKDIADLFGINSATISQYNSNKRAHQINLPPRIIDEIKQSATKINSRLTYLKEVQHLLHIIREQKVLCQIHHDFSNLPDNCDPHHVGCLKKVESAPCLR